MKKMFGEFQKIVFTKAHFFYNAVSWTLTVYRSLRKNHQQATTTKLQTN